MFKMDGYSGKAYRVATLSKSYITSTGIIMQSLKQVNSNMPKLTKKLTVTDGRTDPNYRKASLFKRK